MLRYVQLLSLVQNQGSLPWPLFSDGSEGKHFLSLEIGQRWTLSHKLSHLFTVCKDPAIVMALPNGFPPNPRSVVIFLLPRDDWLPIYHAWHLIFLGYFFIDFPSDISIFLVYFFIHNPCQLLRDPPRWPHCYNVWRAKWREARRDKGRSYRGFI